MTRFLNLATAASRQSAKNSVPPRQSGKSHWQAQAEEAAVQSTEILLGENQTLEEVRIKTINGNEMTYELNGETVTTLIPVGTTVTTKLGTTTTFSRLYAGNTIVMITHDLKVAQAAKRVVRIKDGCLTEMEG